jgi:two-component system NtrC family sensor kinase
VETIPVVVSWRTAQLYASKKGYTFTTPSLTPRNPDNRPDGFERRALEAFQSDPLLDAYDEILPEQEVGVLRYAAPIRLTQDCLACHGGAGGELDRYGQPKEGMSLGDLKGAFVVTAPLASLVARQEGNRRSILWIGLVIIAVTGCVTFVAIRGVLRPLKELLEAIRRIGVGQIQERLSIRSRDEVGELAREFNQMAGRLESSYATLEKRVQERTRDLERSQAQLVQASKLAALGELVGGIAHEINNPTGIIVMRSASLMQEAQAEGLSSGLVDDVVVIQRQSAKIAQITSGLLAFSRQAPFSPQPADINRTITNAVGLVENVLRNRDITYRASLADRLPLVQADTTRIEQVLLNLINNSMDAMPGGGELSVSTVLEADGEGGRWVRIAVRDTGVGIPEEHVDRLFDPFFTTKDVGKGTGLGLAISYGIVQEHGGRLEVESTLGEGSVFHVRLPVDGDGTEV